MVTLRDLNEPRLGTNLDAGGEPRFELPVGGTGIKGMRWYAVVVAVVDLVLIGVAGITALYLRFGLPADSAIAGQWRGANFAGLPYTVVTLLLALLWVGVLAH